MKYIRMQKLHDSPSGKTQVFGVFTKAGISALGVIKWYAPWRAYAFFPNAGTLYEPVCLRDLATFCEQQTRERRAEVRR